MAQKVNPNPSFPFATNPNGFVQWAGSFIQQLLLQFVTYGHRLNLCLPEDGSEAMTSFTYATLPTSPVTGAFVNISDSTTNTWGASITTGGGTDKVLARWNGSNWTVVGK